MPQQLREQVIDPDRIERALWGSITRPDPMYRPALAAIRHCRTMPGMMGAALRLRRWFLFLAERGVAVVDATQDDVQEFLGSMAHLAPSSAEVHLAHVRVMYEEALDRGIVAANPARRVRVGSYTPPVVVALELEQARALLAGIDADAEDPAYRLAARRDGALFALLLSAGPRSGELRGITWGDLELDGAVPHVRLYGKGRKFRTIRLPAVALAALRRYRDELLAAGIGLAPDDALAIGLSARDLAALRDPAARPLRSMSREALYMLVRDLLQAIGVEWPRVGSHRLRSTAATLAYLASGDIVGIQGMLGHDRIDTTRRHYILPADALAATPADRVALWPADGGEGR